MTRAADVDAVHSMYVAHAEALHAYAARRVGRELADDIVAETFRQAIESYPSYDASRDSGTDGRAWLFGIATNLLRRHWRTEQRRLAALARQPGNDRSRPGTDPLLIVPDQVDAARDATQVIAAIDSLASEDYDLLVLVAWEKMSSRDVAQILGIPPGTVRSRLRRVRRELDAARADPRAPAPATTTSRPSRPGGRETPSIPPSPPPSTPESVPTSDPTTNASTIAEGDSL